MPMKFLRRYWGSVLARVLANLLDCRRCSRCGFSLSAETVFLELVCRESVKDEASVSQMLSFYFLLSFFLFTSQWHLQMEDLLR